MTEPAKCHCGSSSWERWITENRFICCSCKRPLWQPMEAAPKNGVTILVYGTWLENSVIRDVAFAYWDEDAECWQFEGEEMFCTHWMPLPEGPKE